MTQKPKVKGKIPFVLGCPWMLDYGVECYDLTEMRIQTSHKCEGCKNEKK